jgi:hypothetical protein
MEVCDWTFGWMDATLTLKLYHLQLSFFLSLQDVPHDIFNKEPDEGYWIPSHKEISGNKFKKATHFFGMLTKNSDATPNGKIYIVWNKCDVALNGSGSFLANSESRIGAKGLGWVDGWFKNSYDEKVIREEFRDYIEAFDVTGEPIKMPMKQDELLQHSYFLEPWAVEFYEKKSKK